MRALALFGLPALVGCFPNVASDQRVDDLDDELEALDGDVEGQLAALRADLDALESKHEAEVADLQGQVSELESRVAELEGRADVTDGLLSEHASTLDDHELRIGDLEGALGAYDATGGTLSEALAEVQTGLGALSSSAVTVIEADTTYDVSSVAELESALAELAMARILPGVTVTIDLADGVYSFDEPLSVDHPDGASLRLVGDEADPDAVTLSFTGTSGVVVPAGRSLGALAGVTLRGDSTAGTTGLEVEANATARWGSLNITGFSYGVYVDYAGVLVPEDLRCPDMIAMEGMGYGVVATSGGVVHVCNATATGMDETGFYADLGSLLIAESATATENGGDGFYAATNAMLYAPSASSEGSGDVGFEARFGAMAYLPYASSKGDQYGFYVSNGSVADARNSSVSGSTTAYASLWSSHLFADNSTVTDVTAQGYLSSIGSSLSADDVTVMTAESAFESSSLSYMDVSGTVSDLIGGYVIYPSFLGAIDDYEGVTVTDGSTYVVPGAESDTYGLHW